MMTTTSDKLDINFVDGEYSIYHSQLKRKGHRTNIRANNINNKYNTSNGRDAERVNYVTAEQQRAVKNARTIIRFVHY